MINNKRQFTRIINTILNSIHAIILILLMVYTLHGIYLGSDISTGSFLGDIVVGIKTTGLAEIFTFIGAIAFVLFGIVGIYEFAYSNGLRFLFPPVYGQLRERRNEKTAEIMMKTYFESDRQFLHTIEMQRFTDVLHILRLTEEQFNQVSYDLLRMRSIHYEDKNGLIEEAKKILLNKEFIVDLTRVPRNLRVYNDVDFYIDLYTAVYNEGIRDEIGKIMTSFIAFEMGNDVYNIDYIVLPENSNLILGITVSHNMGKPLICMQTKARIRNDNIWDGKFEFDGSHTKKIIIIHDVLVSGGCIIDTVKKLPAGSFEVLNLFCLIKYDHAPFAPEVQIEKEGKIGKDHIKCLLTTTERDLR